MPDDNTVLMEGVRIIFRNFRGLAGRFNQEGERNFCVVLDQEIGATLSADGWNVKQFKQNEEEMEEGSPHECYLPVTVKYSERARPPRIVLINSQGKRRDLKEQEVDGLDFVNVQSVDMIVRPYAWDVNGRTGISAYLQSMYMTIEEDALERKYADLEYQNQQRDAEVE